MFVPAFVREDCSVYRFKVCGVGYDQRLSKLNCFWTVKTSEYTEYVCYIPPSTKYTIPPPIMTPHPSDNITLDTLDEVVYYHKPNPEVVEKLELIAYYSKLFMKSILELAPDCYDRTEALHSIRKARMLANSSLVLDPTQNFPIDHSRSL